MFKLESSESFFNEPNLLLSLFRGQCFPFPWLQNQSFCIFWHCLISSSLNNCEVKTWPFSARLAFRPGPAGPTLGSIHFHSWLSVDSVQSLRSGIVEGVDRLRRRRRRRRGGKAQTLFTLFLAMFKFAE